MAVGVPKDLLATGGGAYPGSPPSPVNATTGAGAPQIGGAEIPPAEPVALHMACQVACEALNTARDALAELRAQAELAEMIDPAVEQQIGQASDEVDQLAAMFETMIEPALGAGREQHDMAMEPDGDEAPPLAG